MLPCLIAAFLYQQSSMPVHSLEAPGEIVVEYEDTVSNRKRRFFERSVGLPVVHGYTTRSGEVMETGHAFRYQIPSDQEFFWVNALHPIPFIKKVEPGTPLASKGGVEKSFVLNVDRNALSDKVAGMLGSYSVLKIQRSPIPKMLEDYFNSIYTRDNGQLRVIGKGKHFLHLQVTHLRGEVLRDRNFWEEIEIYAVFFPVDDGSYELHIFLDGKYAASLGNNPPAEAGFSTMETEFYEEENDYLSSIMVSVEDHAARQSRRPEGMKGAKTK